MKTKRNGPATNGAASKNLTQVQSDSSLHRAEDGYIAPTAQDRAVAQAIAVLHEHGYGIALRCLDCHRPITSAASLRRMRGPKCAAKAVTE
jgi:hypothetical protein